ncbi:hypothetical protein VRRI112168_19985 [Vreelandella rituensis]|uniref:Uncharacterized protein n=1 Tax=Vreelandella rituensis TaxID=2282306 RepID=A0A368TM31_9GAMM|nr:hypothetical protein [Halomonas rituensis]RCV85705.1 hypothetical protein DU506_20795 [Halomonas rituensis]
MLINSIKSVKTASREIQSTSTQKPLRTCLPEEQFLLARDHEIQERHRYRGFELSFLPLNPAISQLMAMLGLECEQRLASLAQTAEHLQLGVGLEKCEVHGVIPPDMRRQHFFVVNEDMAYQALNHALAAAYHSHQFHELLVKTCSTLELHVLLKEFVTQKKNACHILEEVQDSLRQLAG